MPHLQLGLKQPIERAAPERSWFHLDNGFSSLEAMRQSHQPIVALARRTLKGLTGNVLDLGCGNGALLAKICDGQSSLTPYGVDTSLASLAHAGALLPRFAANFTASDLFDCDISSRGPRYALTLLMAGRLTEVDRFVANRLMTTLRAQSDAVLVYCYPGRGTRALSSVAQEMGFLLEDLADDTALLRQSE